MIRLIDSIIQLVLKIFGWVGDRPKKELENKRIELEEQSRQAQLNGDLNALRKSRAEIEEIDRRIRSNDY